MNGGELFENMLDTPTTGPMYLSKSFYSEAQPLHSVHPDIYQMRPYLLRTYSLDSFGNYTGMEHPAPLISCHDKTQRSRRRHPPGTHPIKHRRTRSGCYTCRQRRIKCDEARPICDRCRKGKRDCTYPGAASSSSSQARSTKRKASTPGGASAHSVADADNAGRDSDVKSEASNSQHVTPTTSFDSSVYSTQDETTTRHQSVSTVRSNAARPQARRMDSHHTLNTTFLQTARWNQLPQDLHMLLTYFRDHLTEHHYFLREDHGGYLKRMLLEKALSDENEALLYAIAAFASHHHAATYGDVTTSNCLVYYGKSIGLLRQSLKGREQDLSFLLLTLQLATIEASLGNWPNMVNHQKVAYGTLTSLFTPQSIASDDTARQIAAWYMQFDLFNAMISGSDVELSREWFLTSQKFCKGQTQRKPLDPKVRFEEYYTTLRLLGTEMAAFVAARSQDGANSPPVQHLGNNLLHRVAEFGRELEAAFPDCPIITHSSPAGSPFNAGSMLDFTEPEPFYTGNLATMNYVLLDFWTLDLEVKAFVQQQSPADLCAVALKICGMVEAIHQSNQEPFGSTLSCCGGLRVASYFLPKEPQYFNWLRFKFAGIERSGLTYPDKTKRDLFEAWGFVSDDFWLPNNIYSSPVMHIPEFIDPAVDPSAAHVDPVFPGVGGSFDSLPPVDDFDFNSVEYIA